MARRAALWAENVVYGDSSSPVSGPRLTSAVWDSWSADWGNYHYETGAGSYVCATGTRGPFLCGGIRLTFDQPVTVRSFYSSPNGLHPSKEFYGFASGASSGFEVWADGNTSASSSWFQPAVLTSISPDGLLVQLNITWVNPLKVAPPTVLKYAWHDYPPAMPLVGLAGNLPVSPFNATITPA